MESEFPLSFLVSRLYGLIGVQEWLGRGLSVLCSALTIWLVMGLGRRWFNPEAGWWAGLALAIAPLGVYFGAPFRPKPCCCSVPPGPWRASASGVSDGRAGLWP